MSQLNRSYFSNYNNSTMSMNEVTIFFKALTEVFESAYNIIIKKDEETNKSRVNYDGLNIETPPDPEVADVVSEIIVDVAKTIKTVVNIIMSILTAIDSIKMSYESVKSQIIDADVALE